VQAFGPYDNTTQLSLRNLCPFLIMNHTLYMKMKFGNIPVPKQLHTLEMQESNVSHNHAIIIGNNLKWFKMLDNCFNKSY